MRLRWAGTTWNMAANEAAVAPIDRSPVDLGDAQRSVYGTLRTHFAYRRWGFDLSFEGLVTSGTTMKNLRYLGTYTGGTIELADSLLGTWTTMAIPGSYKETCSGWDSSSIQIRLEQL